MTAKAHPARKRSAVVSERSPARTSLAQVAARARDGEEGVATLGLGPPARCIEAGEPATRRFEVFGRAAKFNWNDIGFMGGLVGMAFGPALHPGVQDGVSDFSRPCGHPAISRRRASLWSGGWRCGNRVIRAFPEGVGGELAGAVSVP